MTDLSALIERLEGASGPDREIDAALMVALCGARRVDEFNFYGPNEEHWSFGEHEEENGAWNGPLPHLTASIDAALAFVERVLPGWEWERKVAIDGPFVRLVYGDWRVESVRGNSGPDRSADARDTGNTPLAILVAALKALQERGEG